MLAMQTLVALLLPLVAAAILAAPHAAVERTLVNTTARAAMRRLSTSTARSNSRFGATSLNATEVKIIQSRCRQACPVQADSSCLVECENAMYDCDQRHSQDGGVRTRSAAETDKLIADCQEKVLERYKSYPGTAHDARTLATRHAHGEHAQSAES
eukprot:gnl/TRDRNA2_/TRDRNA2_81065_c1_seq1.p1 gnl/TRDRNA2_/TRDRNA2_81065_c1~~gnl/TRDRNA2_/TRDRNA2_81065_c1_seq1.p1  ORF type:complete len:156 (-),score=18.24 gnl/TRDRNA2_/TRDRNA2_81065_c1_seq1:73-540(-)